MPVQLAAHGHHVHDFEFDLVFDDGTRRTLFGNAEPLPDESGEPQGAIGIFIDITEIRQMDAAFSDEITHRRQAELNVKKALSQLNAALESTADGIYVISLAGKITGYNQNFASMWNIPGDLLESGDNLRVSDYLSTLVVRPEIFREESGEIRHHKDRESYDMLELRDGRIFERYSKPQRLEKTIVGRVWSFRDVTDRRHAEQGLLASLKEKETLIREIHHRVKNNLQIISGLLDMTRMRTKDPLTTGILTDMMMKIKTMAQIHTRLYESKQFDRINMGAQIRDQVTDLSGIYGRSGAEITTDIEIQEIFLPVDQAIPCALVVNEILSNTFKHAFSGRLRGTIRVTVTQTDSYFRISVQDDGVGIPGDVDVYHTTSLGLKLIRSLVLQLRGTLVINSSPQGSEVIVEFPFRISGS
jgi:two-component sensor histidine kinase/PAS domain-containing protein